MRSNLSRGIGVIDPLARDVHNAEKEPTPGEENSQKKNDPDEHRFFGRRKIYLRERGLDDGNRSAHNGVEDKSERIAPRGTGIKPSKQIAQTSAHPTDSKVRFSPHSRN